MVEREHCPRRPRVRNRRAVLRPPSPRRPYTEREAIPEAISAGARIVVLDAVCDDGISLPTVFGISVAEASTNAQAAAFRRPPRWLSPNVKTSGNAAVRRCRGPQLQLTKSAPLGGDSETRTLKGPGEATWASRRAVLASLREPPSRSIGHFQQVHAAAPLTRRPESSSSDYLAPQVGLEPTTLRLTARQVHQNKAA